MLEEVQLIARVAECHQLSSAAALALRFPVKSLLVDSAEYRKLRDNAKATCEDYWAALADLHACHRGNLVVSGTQLKAN